MLDYEIWYEKVGWLADDLEEEYLKDVEVVKDNTLKLLTNFKGLKKELNTCDNDKSNEIKYYITALKSALQSLSNELQSLIAYIFFEGMELADVSRALGYNQKSTDNIKIKCEYAFQELENILFEVWNIEAWEHI